MHGKQLLLTLMVVVLLVPLTACYQVVVYSGAPPSPEPESVIREEWHHSYLFGLVAPDTLELPSTCDAGITKFEVGHSFLNVVVTVLTAGVYSPLDLRIECAAAGDPQECHSDSCVRITGPRASFGVDEARRTPGVCENGEGGG